MAAVQEKPVAVKVAGDEDDALAQLDAERERIMRELAEIDAEHPAQNDDGRPPPKDEPQPLPAPATAAPPAAAPGTPSAAAPSRPPSAAVPPASAVASVAPHSSAAPPAACAPDPAASPVATAARPSTVGPSRQAEAPSLTRTESLRPVRGGASSRHRQPPVEPDPLVRLNELLLECEKEVRDAKGYIEDPSAVPLKIVRVKKGEEAPKTATFLSRPKDTGVDFRVPVEVPGYRDFVENPITLNNIRDRCRARKYTRYEQYLDDMRRLAKNTRDFNVDPEVQWVVQHGQHMLEAAIDAVEARKKALITFETEISNAAGVLSHLQAPSPHQTHRPAPSPLPVPSPSPAPSSGRRKRDSTPSSATLTFPPIGSVIEVFWPPDDAWFEARVLKYATSSRIEVEFPVDGTRDWIQLESTTWRMPKTKGGGGARSKGMRGANQDGGSSKRRRTQPELSEPTEEPNTAGVTLADLESIRAEMLHSVAQMRVELVHEVQTAYGRLLASSDQSARLSAVESSLAALETLVNQVQMSREQELRELKSELTERLRQQP